ncbi:MULTISPECIES: hypothetical protein [unclassified Sulfitobacter]|uniref:hypothetical protein n=1 Tax=unclassified Sulfitobacter TaxID=196795 RepID=UPI000B0E5E7E|nr:MULTISPECIES: hypothetical protein [unclassified Sulfitobacter]
MTKITPRVGEKYKIVHKPNNRIAAQSVKLLDKTEKVVAYHFRWVNALWQTID